VDAAARGRLSPLLRRVRNRLRSAPLLIVGSAFMFATMGVCVKLASAHYAAGEIVMYRCLVGALCIGGLTWLRGGSLRTRVPALHLRRSVSGVISLCLWFYAMAHLPLATSITLVYTSSVWMALFLIASAVRFGTERVERRLVAAVLVGFAGVALVLRPTLDQHQIGYGIAGLAAGLSAAVAYLQVAALGRAGEPDHRVVFYFCLAGTGAGALTLLWTGAHSHSASGLGLLMAVGLLATLAQMMLTRAYRIGRTLSNAILQYTGIAFGFGFGVLVFDDPVTWSAMAGMVLIVLAGWATTAARPLNEALER
jgi:drug/metabolite transporter (DMT)-like permease